MPVDLLLPLSMALAIVGWALVFVWYVHPVLKVRPFANAMRPLLLLHVFRYVGLMFLLPGVTAVPLDPRFAVPAAYGDLMAAALALLAIVALEWRPVRAMAAVWLFNVWGLVDLINAVARGLLYAPDGALGAAYWIPAVIVPLLVVSHVYIFARLAREHSLARSPTVAL